MKGAERDSSVGKGLLAMRRLTHGCTVTGNAKSVPQNLSPSTSAADTPVILFCLITVSFHVISPGLSHCLSIHKRIQLKTHILCLICEEPVLVQGQNLFPPRVKL